MIEKCLQQAKELGFNKVYLESMPELKQALNIYEKFGFQYLKAQMGNSGHTGCQKWMIKVL
jgi:putative acetyltransferase